MECAACHAVAGDNVEGWVRVRLTATPIGDPAWVTDVEDVYCPGCAQAVLAEIDNTKGGGHGA